MTPRPRVAGQFPHPVALPYSLVFDGTLKPSERVWALCFTQYQVLRLVVLAHVSQYVRDAIDTTAKAAVKATNEQIAGLKSPMFSNWVTAVRTLPRQWPALKLSPPFPDLVERLKKLPSSVRPVPDSSGATKLPPLEAVVALRNSIAHGGIPDQKQAERHLAEYLPVLDEVLTAFDFLADCRLLVCDDAEKAKQGLPVVLRTLRSTTLPEPEEVELSPELEAAFGESPAVLVTPAGVPISLDPLLRPLPHDEPLYLYDGHYGIRVTAKTEAVNRYVYYLGVRDKRSGTPECQSAAERLRELLAARYISYDLPKERVHPWTIAEAALDYSRRTVADLLGTKYFPECYEPFPNLDDHLDRFLTVPDRREWKDTTRPRFRNGLLLLGTAGSGKTALLARRVEHLLARPASPDAPADPEADRGNPNVVLFLRGNGIALRPDGVSLFRDVAEKLGVSVGDKGVGSFDELFAHLHAGFVKDQVPGRRLVLVFDALNEAPFAEQITREALQLVSLAARFPWSKVVLSTRDEWLAILPEKMTATEADPRAEARDHLYDPDPNRPPDQRRLPAVYLEPLSADHAGRIYHNHQARARAKTDEGYAIPACATPWDELPADVRKLLTNPLYLYLFQRAFAGRPVGAVAGVPELYAAYVESAYERNIGPAVRAVVEYLCGDPDRTTADLTDDDVNALRLRWNAGRTPAEIRTDFHPAEMLVHEGFVTKRVREEGGGYRFVYQTVAEYLIYRHLRDEMPPGGDEFAYWLTLAQRETAFPEYAGAMLFVLRNWEKRDDAREWIGQLVEEGADWTRRVLTKLLEELTRADFVPGKPSARGERMVKCLSPSTSKRVALALLFASDRLRYTRHLPSSDMFQSLGVSITEQVHLANPDDLETLAMLYEELVPFSVRCKQVGRLADAERYLRRVVELTEEHWRRDATNPNPLSEQCGALRHLCELLDQGGREGERRALLERGAALAVWLNARVAGVETGPPPAGRDLTQIPEREIAELFTDGLDRMRARLRAEPESEHLAEKLVDFLRGTTHFHDAHGRPTEAEAALREALAVYTPWLKADDPPPTLVLDQAKTYHALGTFLVARGRIPEGVAEYQQAVTHFESAAALDPVNREAAEGLAKALSDVANSFNNEGRKADAEAAYLRSVRVYENLDRLNPNEADIADRLAFTLIRLGLVRVAGGQHADAVNAFHRAVEIREGLSRQHPTDRVGAKKLVLALIGLESVLQAASRPAAADTVTRRLVEVCEVLYHLDPDDIDNKIGLAAKLGNLGRYAEARRLVREVLVAVPDHSDAKKLDDWLLRSRIGQIPFLLRMSILAGLGLLTLACAGCLFRGVTWLFGWRD